MADIKGSRKKNGSVGELLISGAITLIIILLTALIAAAVTNIYYVNSEQLETASLVSLVASAMISGFVNSRLRGFRVAFLSSVFVTLLLLLVGIILAKRGPEARALMNYLCFLLTSLAGIYLGRKREKKHRRADR